MTVRTWAQGLMVVGAMTVASIAGAAPVTLQVQVQTPYHLVSGIWITLSSRHGTGSGHETETQVWNSVVKLPAAEVTLPSGDPGSIYRLAGVSIGVTDRYDYTLMAHANDFGQLFDREVHATYMVTVRSEVAGLPRFFAAPDLALWAIDIDEWYFASAFEPIGDIRWVHGTHTGHSIAAGYDPAYANWPFVGMTNTPLAVPFAPTSPEALSVAIVAEGTVNMSYEAGDDYEDEAWLEFFVLDGVVNATYTYELASLPPTPDGVPAPGTAALLALGLLALRRRPAR